MGFDGRMDARSERKYSVGFAVFEAGLAALTYYIPHPRNLSDAGDFVYYSLIYAGVGIFSLLSLESIYGAFRGEAHPILKRISCRAEFRNKIGSDLKKILYNRTS